MNVDAVNTGKLSETSNTSVLQNLQQDSSQSSDFAQLIMQIVSEGSKEGNNALEMLSQAMKGKSNSEKSESEISQLLAQLLTMQTYGLNGSENVSGQLEELAKSPELVTTGINDSVLKNMETVLQLQKILSGKDTKNDADISQLTELFGKDGAIKENIFSDVSVNPYEVLYALTNNGKLTEEKFYEEYKDISSKILGDANSQKPDLLKNAIENGEAVISKDTALSDVIGEMSEGYRLTAAVKKSESEISALKGTSSAAESSESEKVKSDSGKAENTGMAVIDYNKTSQLPQQVKTDGTSEENAVYNQTLDSVSRMMKNGAESYTAKLNPQGLGEIVVKMVKDESGIVINIVASSQKTAEILNNHLVSLQASLSDYKAQINPAQVEQVVSPQEAYHYQGYSFAGQNFGGDSQEQKQLYSDNYSRNSYKAGAGNDEERNDEVNFHSGKINTYI